MSSGGALGAETRAFDVCNVQDPAQSGAARCASRALPNFSLRFGRVGATVDYAHLSALARRLRR